MNRNQKHQIKMTAFSVGFFFLAALLPVSSTFCVEPSENLTISMDDFPLEAGLTVEYVSKSTNKTINADIVRHEYLDGSEINDIKFIKRIASMPNTDKQISYFYKAKDGIMRVPTMSSDERTLLVKLPLSVGTEWTHDDYEGTSVKKSTKKAEAVETIKTPLGDLQCIKIRQKKEGAKNDDEDFFLWVAKKYGIVQLETNRKTQNGTIIKTVLTISKFEEAKETKSK
jgi:hypothetical protein